MSEHVTITAAKLGVETIYNTGEIRWNSRPDGVFLQQKFNCVGMKDGRMYSREEWRDVPTVQSE